jgi:protein-disulfide isomerase
MTLPRISPLVFLFVFVLTSAARADMPDRDMEALRMMQQRAEAARIEDEIKNPKTPKVPKDRAFDGDRNAPLVVIEYSDFQCPYCKKGFETIEELKQKYGKKMGFMFRHMPLPFHPMAMPAAIRFEAISLQSAKKAYAFHDEVFANQDEMVRGGEAYLDAIATRLKVNMKKMKADMVSDKVKKRIADDTAEAKTYDMTGTPGFLAAGVVLKGAYPTEIFTQIFDQRLKTGRTVAQKVQSK